MIISKIKIHYSLIFLLLLSLFTGSFFKILGIICCIFLHEFSHFIFLKLFKIKVKSLELSIIGGILEIDDFKLTLSKRLIINCAGIICNIIIILIIKFLGLISLKYLITYNIFIIIFNLIPIIPLDGFRILNDILSSIYDDTYTYILIKRIDLFCLIMMLIILMCLKVYGLFLIWLFLVYRYLRYNIDDKKIKNISMLLKK